MRIQIFYCMYSLRDRFSSNHVESGVIYSFCALIPNIKGIFTVYIWYVLLNDYLPGGLQQKISKIEPLNIS